MICRFVLLLILIGLTAHRAHSQDAHRNDAATALVLGQVLIDSLVSGDVHAFAIYLPLNHFVYGDVDQQSVDVVVTVYGPDGRRIGTFDLLGRGPEPFQFTTETSGIHRVEVKPFQQEEGRYTLLLERVEPSATSPEQRVDQHMAAYDRTDVPGAVILVMRDGETILSKGYGAASLEHRIPITPRTVFDVGSISKQFTGLAIAMLHEQGALSIDEDVQTYLPDMPDYGTPVTVRHLIHHTAGLRDWDAGFVLAGLRSEDVFTFGDVVAFARRQRELNFEPGSEMLYSNTGYALLARVVEAVTGQPFSDWMKANIFAPLAMEDTRFLSDRGTIVLGRAHSYSIGGDGQLKSVVNNLSVVGSSSLLTTAEDLGKWLLNFEHQQVGGPAGHSLMRWPGVLTSGDTTSYAFGIAVDEHRGLQRLSHSGGWAGFSTVLHYYPEINAGVAVLSNYRSFNTGRTADEVAGAYFGDIMAPEESMPQSSGDDGMPPELWSPDPEELEAYAGRYFSPELEAFYTVEVRAGQLIALHARHDEMDLVPTSKDVFEGSRWFFSSVRFERGAAGAVTAMRVSNGRVRNLLFEKQECM